MRNAGYKAFVLTLRQYEPGGGVPPLYVSYIFDNKHVEITTDRSKAMVEYDYDNAMALFKMIPRNIQDLLVITPERK